jgi:hypothetical protein
MLAIPGFAVDGTSEMTVMASKTLNFLQPCTTGNIKVGNTMDHSYVADLEISIISHENKEVPPLTVVAMTMTSFLSFLTTKWEKL